MTRCCLHCGESIDHRPMVLLMKWDYQDDVEYAADNLVRKDLLKDPDHEMYPRELLLDAIRHLRKQLDRLRSENQQLVDTAEEYRLEVRRLRNR